MSLEYMLREPIMRGTYCGLTVAFHERGIPFAEAEEFYNRQNYHCANGKEQGIRDGLVQIGRLKKTWWGGYRRTNQQDQGR